jgi:recombination protein RecA
MFALCTTRVHFASLLRVPAQSNVRRLFSGLQPSSFLLARKAKSEVDVSSTNVVADEKKAALSQALKAVETNFGKGAIMRLGDSTTLRSHMSPQAVISTGSLSLDSALGVGGVARGRIIEIYGPEMSGKTTLALHIVAEAQKKGGTAVFIDAEHALDTKYAAALGVNVDDLYLAQPDCGEQALEIVDTLIRSGAPDVVVVDSVAALTPRAEIEGEMGDLQIGLQARLMSQALRKLAATVNRTQTVLIFINQLRMKIGVMFGNPETTPGGNALKFYASQRLEIRRESSLKKGDVVVGNMVKVKVVKNKLAPPFRQVSFEIEFGRGMNKFGELIDLGVQHGVVERQGSWFQYGEHKLGQGKEKAKVFLQENKHVSDELERKVKEALFASAERMGSSSVDPEPLVADDDNDSSHKGVA